jgi:hypothetical protein
MLARPDLQFVMRLACCMTNWLMQGFPRLSNGKPYDQISATIFFTAWKDCSLTGPNYALPERS